MTSFDSGYVADNTRSFNTKNVGLRLTTLGTVTTINDVNMQFSGSAGTSIRCYVQDSAGTITQIGPDYTWTGGTGSHTFSAGSPVSLNSADFIVWIYHVGGGGIDLRVQYSGTTSGTGTEVFTSSSTTTPAYSDWSSASCSGTCGVPMTFTYDTDTPSGTGTLLPPPVAWI